MFYKCLISGGHHTGRLVKLINLPLYLLLVSFSNSLWAAPAYVWSQLDAADINVYFSPDGISTIQLTTRGKNVLPALDRQANQIWLSWVDKGGSKDDRLNYARLTASGSVLEKGLVPASSGKLYAPSIAIEPSGKRVWIVWVEYNGRTEELFASYLNISRTTSRGWVPAIQITANDEFSANLPRIDKASSGQIEISWLHTGPGLSLRASTMISTRSFDGDLVTALESRQMAIKYDSANGQYPRIQYITERSANTGYNPGWKKLTRDRTALMGAVISDSGSVTRIVDRR